MNGGDAGDVLSGLGSISPLTATLARLGSSENGLAAGLAATYVGAGGMNGIKDLLSGDATLAAKAGLTPEALKAQVGISMSSWRTDRRWSESQASELTAGGDIVLKAGLDALLTQGTQVIAAGDVRIEAQRDIEVSALLDYARQKSSSWGLSANLQGVSGNISKAKGDAILATNGAVQAGGEAELVAGRDINLIGGNAVGDKVTVDAGRDLTITSLQDTSNFKQTGLGVSISYGGAVSGSFSSTKANYANVNQPAGIIAGDGGFDVKADGTVDLTAGLIVSSADPALNSLEANRLVVRDLENTSKAKTSGFGVSINGGTVSPAMKTDETIRLEASQDALYFTEKGFYIGLSFPGSSAIDAALNGGDAGDVLSGLGSISPLTATLARLGTSENGLAAGLAATYVGAGGMNGIKDLLSSDATLAAKAGLTPEALKAQIGISMSSWRTDRRWSESQASELTAGGDIVQVAGFAEDSPEKVALHAVAGAITTTRCARTHRWDTDRQRQRRSFGAATQPGPA